MPNDLAPAKLRQLIAAATPGPWQHKIDTSWPTKDRIIDSPSQVIVRDEDCYKHYKCNRGDDRNFDLIVYLFNNAPPWPTRWRRRSCWSGRWPMVSIVANSAWGMWRWTLSKPCAPPRRQPINRHDPAHQLP